MERPCQRCGKRWAQDAGLCRRCGRETGAYQLNCQQADAALIERQRAAQHVAVVVSRQPRIRVIDGQEFEVVFDGAVR